MLKFFTMPFSSITYSMLFNKSELNYAGNLHNMLQNNFIRYVMSFSLSKNSNVWLIILILIRLIWQARNLLSIWNLNSALTWPSKLILQMRFRAQILNEFKCIFCAVVWNSIRATNHKKCHDLQKCSPNIF